MNWYSVALRAFPIFLLSALAAAWPAQAALRVAYPAPPHADIITPALEQRIVIGGFLDDFFKHAGTNRFAGVRNAVKRTIINQMDSGAWVFATDDARVNFSRWKPIDLYACGTWEAGDAGYDRRAPLLRVDFFAQGANASRRFALNDLTGACVWLADRILATAKLPADEEKKMRAFVAERRPFLHGYYVSPCIEGHYCDNGVDTRMPHALDCWKASRFHPLVATRVVDAAYLLVLDHRRLQKYTGFRVKAIGMDALERLVGRLDPLDEDIILPFVYHYRSDVRKLLDRLEKRLAGDSLENLEEGVLGGAGDALGDDEAELSLTAKPSAADVAKTRAAIQRLRAWCDHGYEKAPPDPREAEEVARCVTGGGEHPLAVRHKLAAAAARKDVAFLESHLNDVFRQTRAYALTKLAEVDPERAYPHALKAMEDCHTWTRLYASIVLAKRAKAQDAAKIRAFLQGERNRCVKLYLADALAMAEGRPLPPPRPAAHTIPKDRALVWLCGGRGALTDVTPWEGYYTCALPELKPNDVIRRAYASGKIFLSRPTPIGEGAHVVSDPGAADTFWTTLEKQLPDECLACQDGFVYGEESMAMSATAAWRDAWKVFCAEAGIDPTPIAGDIRKLTPAQRRRYDDWGLRVAIEGFNALYDFTKDYYGKLKPGILVATYMGGCCGGMGPHAKDWKFDVSAGYIYGTGPTPWPRHRNRAAYGHIRMLRTLWPDRPCQWLSWGAPTHPCVGEVAKREAEAARKAHRTPMKLPCYRQIWEQAPYWRRWEEAYSANITCWQAGGMPGYFASYATKCKKGGGSCVWLDTEGMYPGYPSQSLDAGIAYAFGDTLVDYRDALRRADGPTVSDDEMDGEEVELEEEGGQGDPAYQQQQADIAKFRQGYMTAMRYMYDTARAQVGMPYYDPKDFKSLLMLTGRGRGTECSASQWMDGFDVVSDASHAVITGNLPKYRFIAVTDATGTGTRMDEATRQAYLRWLKETPGVLWVEGYLGENARCSFEHPDGDLRTPWPWKPSVTNGTDAITVWRDPAYKAIVIFERPQRTATDEPIARGGQVVKDFFAKNGVDFKFPRTPGMISTKVGNFEVHALSQRAKYEGRVEGVELLTGETNPLVTTNRNEAFAMVVKGDWFRPWVAVHEGVRVLAGNRFEKAEPVAGGVRVKGAPGPFGEPSAQPATNVVMRQEGGARVFVRP